MQEPSRQLLRHFTGRLAQGELLELRPEFAIANSGQDKGILVILLGVWEVWARLFRRLVLPAYFWTETPRFGGGRVSRDQALAVGPAGGDCIPGPGSWQSPASRSRKEPKGSRKGTLVVFEELWGKWVTW